MIAFVIWSAVAAVMLAIGMVTRRSAKPAAFFAGVNAPKVRDAKGYNRAVSRLWFIYAAVLEVIGLPLIYVQQNDPLVMIPVVAAMGATIWLIAAYSRVEQKYTK